MQQSARRLVSIVLAVTVVVLAAAGGYRAWVRKAKPHNPMAPAGVTTPEAPPSPRVDIGPYNIVLPLPAHRGRTWEARARAIEGDLATRAGRLIDVTCIMREHGQEALRVRGDSADIELLTGGSAFRAAVRGHVRAWEMRRDMLITADEFSWLSTEDTATVLKPVWEGLGLRNAAERGTFDLALTRGTLYKVRTTHD